MHNPFQLYSPRLLDGLLKAGHTHFVRQTYKRGIDHFDPLPKGSFLVTPYNETAKANMHYEALVNDANRFIYNTGIKEHLEKLHIAANQPAGYKIYAPLLPGPWKPSDIMAGKIRIYVSRILKWHPGKQGVHSDLFLQFGELFITLKSGIHEVKIPLSDIERL
jgi:hypothetical protein